MASLREQVKALAGAVAADYKQLRTWTLGGPTADLTSLATSDKSSLIAAINELFARDGGTGNPTAFAKLVDWASTASAGNGSLIARHGIGDPVVIGQYGAPASQKSVDVPITQSVQEGDTIIVEVVGQIQAAQNRITAVTDGVGNAYSLAPNPGVNGVQYAQYFWAHARRGLVYDIDANITPKITVSSDAAQPRLAIRIMTLTGLWEPETPVDQSIGAAFNTATRTITAAAPNSQAETIVFATHNGTNAGIATITSGAGLPAPTALPVFTSLQDGSQTPTGTDRRVYSAWYKTSSVVTPAMTFSITPAAQQTAIGAAALVVFKASQVSRISEIKELDGTVDTLAPLPIPIGKTSPRLSWSSASRRFIWKDGNAIDLRDFASDTKGQVYTGNADKDTAALREALAEAQSQNYTVPGSAAPITINGRRPLIYDGPTNYIDRPITIEGNNRMTSVIKQGPNMPNDSTMFALRGLARNGQYQASPIGSPFNTVPTPDPSKSNSGFVMRKLLLIGDRTLPNIVSPIRCFNSNDDIVLEQVWMTAFRGTLRLGDPNPADGKGGVVREILLDRVKNYGCGDWANGYRSFEICQADMLVTKTSAVATGGMASGTKNLAVSTAGFFTATDAASGGVSIRIQGAGTGGADFIGKIVTYTDATHVVLDRNISTTVAAGAVVSVGGADADGTNQIELRSFDLVYPFGPGAAVNHSSSEVMRRIKFSDKCMIHGFNSGDGFDQPTGYDLFQVIGDVRDIIFGPYMVMNSSLGVVTSGGPMLLGSDGLPFGCIRWMRSPKSNKYPSVAFFKGGITALNGDGLIIDAADAAIIEGTLNPPNSTANGQRTYRVNPTSPLGGAVLTVPTVPAGGMPGGASERLSIPSGTGPGTRGVHTIVAGDRLYQPATVVPAGW